MKSRSYLVVIAILATVGCATPGVDHQSLSVPKELEGKVVVLTASDPDFPRAHLERAKSEANKGGISDGLAVKTTEDLTVYRLWNGPKVDKYGTTNRFGSWWTYTRPSGDSKTYREKYAVCATWNDLTWVAQCTLKAGSTVAIGPGQSATCPGTPTVTYPAQPDTWQMYLDCALCRRSELQCGEYLTSDYEADENDLIKHKATITVNGN